MGFHGGGVLRKRSAFRPAGIGEAAETGVDSEDFRTGPESWQGQTLTARCCGLFPVRPARVLRNARASPNGWTSGVRPTNTSRYRTVTMGWPDPSPSRSGVMPAPGREV